MPRIATRFKVAKLRDEREKARRPPSIFLLTFFAGVILGVSLGARMQESTANQLVTHGKYGHVEARNFSHVEAHNFK